MNVTHSALVVDDERDIRELLVLTLGRMGLRISTAANLAEARELLANNSFDLCLTDMRLPDGNGIELVGEIARDHPRTPVAMITAFGSMDLAVEALKAGAFDFVSKPVDIGVLRGMVRHALELNNAERPAQPTPAEGASRLRGESQAMESLRATIAKVARSQAPVYILGESGVGKELVAHTIHEQGARAAGPFVPVNCGAIPGELMESEFFGHRRAASPAPMPTSRGCSRPRTAAPCSSMKWPSCHCKCRSSCCAPSRKNWYAQSAQPPRYRWTCASSRPPTRTCPNWCRTAVSATTCTTASTSSSCVCRRCASAAKICRSWPPRSSADWPARRTCPRRYCHPRHWTHWPATPFPATCANWRTCSNAPSPWPKATASVPPTCACLRRATRRGAPCRRKPWPTSTRPTLRCRPTSSRWNAPRSRRRWKKTAGTAPAPPHSWASPSARCATSWRKLGMD